MDGKELELYDVFENGGQLSFDLGDCMTGAPVTSGLAQVEEKISAAVDTDLMREADFRQMLWEEKRVVFSNRFAVGIEEGTRFAHKLSRIAIAKINPTDVDMPLITISGNDLKALGMTKNRLSSHMNSVIDEILQCRVKIASWTTPTAKDTGKKPKDARLTGINMFSMASAIPGKGAIVIQLNPLLKEHFLELKENFTQYELAAVIRMNSVQASRLHEILLSKSREYNANLLRFHISDLMKALNYTPTGETKAASRFMTNVIKRAVATIRENTGLTVEYKGIRVGRSFQDVRFFIDGDYKTLREKQEAEKSIEESVEHRPEFKRVMEDHKEKIQTLLDSGEGEVFFDSLF